MAVKQKNEVRVWRATLNSRAGVMLRPDTLTLIGSENNFIHLDKDSVSICANKINFTTDPMNISKGVLFKEQLGFLQLLPSNMAMPVANMLVNIPGDGIVKAMKQPMSVLAVAQAGGII